MKKIGIIVAVKDEFETFLKDNSFKIEKIDTTCFDVEKTIINDNEIYVLRSGYGEIDASAGTQFLISVFGVEYILNYGVVGALKSGLKVQDLFLIEKVVHYDFDASSIDGTRIGEYLDIKDIYMKTNSYLNQKVIELMPNILPVICASGDKFIADINFKKELANEFNASICDMESAAIIRVSLKNKIPCVAIKCISDTLEGTGKDYLENVSMSSKIAFDLIKKLLFAI
jgi:adenosylhomocysteine nucleosidase